MAGSVRCDGRLSPVNARRYTAAMDSVRFGRVLGIGTRLAAKTLVSAVDAAKAPSPAGAGGGGTGAVAGDRAGGTGSLGQKAARTVTQTAVQVKQTRQGVVRGSKKFGEAVWGPFVRLGGVLWLELTGVFFGLFALTAGVGAWKQRAEWHGAAGQHGHLLMLGGMAVMFGYFCLTSFMKARRREKGR